jgi:probable HAF family extracellular repeat protein
VNLISRLSSGLAALGLLSTAPALFGSGYTITNLTVPGMPSSYYVVGLDINNAGQILLGDGPSVNSLVGTTYIYTPSTSTYQALPDDPDARPNNTFFSTLNNSDQVVGNELPTNLGTYQSLLYSGGTFTNITPPASFESDFSAAFGINDSGQIVGTWETASDHEQGYLLSGGVDTTIDVPGLDTELFGINDDGDIIADAYPIGDNVPSYGFEYSGGVFTPIVVPGQANVEPLGINDSGVIVGEASNDENFVVGDVAFINSGGTTTFLNIPGAIYTDIAGINDAGDVVGSYELPDGNFRAFLATPNGAAPDASRTAILLALGLLGLAMIRARLASNSPVPAL